MSTLYQLTTVFFIVSAGVALVSAYQYKLYRTPIGRWGMRLLFILGIELASYAMLWVSAGSQSFRFWFFLVTLSFMLLHTLWLFFVDAFSNQPRRVNANLAFGIVSLPLLALSILFTSQLPLSPPVESVSELNWVFRNISIFGQWVYLLTPYLLLFLLLAAAFIVRLFYRPATAADRSLYLPMLAGILFLLILAGLEMFGLNPLRPVSSVQVGLGLASWAFLFYTRIYKFGNILPVDNGSIFSIMRDGCILLDAENRVVDINPQAESWLHCRKKDWVNRDLSAVWPEVARVISEQPLENYLVKEVPTQDAFLHQILITRFGGINNTTTGRLITLRNITERDQLEATLIERSQEMARTNTFMQELAELNLLLQASNDLPAIYDALQDRLAKVGLDFLVMLVDPTSQDLSMGYISLDANIVERIEKATGLQFEGFHLDRSSFSSVYSYLDDKKADHFITTWEEESQGNGTFGSLFIGIVLQILGIEAQSPMVAFHLMAGDQVIGLMAIWGKELQVKNLHPLRIFTSQVAWAIERIHIYEQEKQRSAGLERSNQLLTALANVSAQMGRSSESSTALAVLGQELEAIGLHCILGSVDLVEEAITIQYASFLNRIKRFEKYMPAAQLVGYKLPKRVWPNSLVIDEGIPGWYKNVHSIFWKMFPMIPEQVFQAALAQVGTTDQDRLCILPLIVDGKVTGVLPIWGESIDEIDTPGLMVFAHQVAEFLRKTEGFEKAAARADNLARSNQIVIALSNVAASLETTSDLKAVFESLSKEMLKVNLNCMIGTLDGEKQFLTIEHLSVSLLVMEWAEKLGFSWSKDMRIPRHLWPTDRAVTERAPYWDPDPIANVSRMFPFLPKEMVVKAFEMVRMGRTDQVCYLPMIIEEDVIGIMAVWGPNLQVDDLPGLSVFSNQVATAIKNTTLYKQAQEEILIRRQAEARIQTALNEKEVLLKEIHHRVKNNLQVISSLLNLQMGQSKDAGYTEALRESQNRVRAMALIHEKLYQSDDLARIHFSSYLHGLLNYLSQSYRVSENRISVQVEISDILLDLDTAIPCGLIINELVSNAFKYAFPDGRDGTISISCHPVGADRYLLTISDNGIGLPVMIDPARSTTLGLKLVASLVRQINGKITVAGNPGTRYAIEFSQQEE